MSIDAFSIVFYAIDEVFHLFLILTIDHLFYILVGFFVSFSIYRFIIRPLAGGGFVDPSSVLRAFKGADSDEARKPEKK